jgi:hypothetical protein
MVILEAMLVAELGYSGLCWRGVQLLPVEVA